MSTNTLLCAITASAIVLTAMQASAQKKIDDIIQNILDNKQYDVTYSERRDPQSRKIVESSHIINSSDRNLFKKLRQAFQDERKQSVNYSQVGNDIITITFVEGSTTSTYSLIRDDDESWMLSANKQSTGSKNNTRKSSGRSNTTHVYINGNHVTTTSAPTCEEITVVTRAAQANAQVAQANARIAQENARKAQANARKAQANARKAQANARKAQANARKAQADARRAQRKARSTSNSSSSSYTFSI